VLVRVVPTLSRKEEARRAKALASAKSLSEAARRCGVSASAFRQWALSRSTARVAKRIDPALEDRRLRAYSECATDAAAARFLKIKPNTFRNWRATRGLPAKTPPPWEWVQGEAAETRLTAYRTHGSVRKAARELGIQHKTLWAWLRNNHPKELARPKRPARRPAIQKKH
jgi:predicted DNA-binding protein (UPF0251 family)